jgi:nifR3 family TIM-barrel protein
MMQLADPISQPTLRPLELGGLRLERGLFLAPMAGVTNLPFRLIARESGAALAYTETVSARGLVEGGEGSWRLLKSEPDDAPLVHQLFGNDPGVLGAATELLVGRGAQLVDLNLGCPVKKFRRHGAGAWLMRDPDRIGPLLAAMRKALPEGVLSIKIRTGWDASSINAPLVARIAEAEGADFVSIHGRTGSQLYRGAVNREHIAEVVEAVRIPVIANGDIVTPQDALEMLAETGADGVMIGRGALSNPWIFSQVIELAEGREIPRPSAQERAALVEKHLDLVIRTFPEPRYTVHMLKKYLCAYASGLRGASSFRKRVQRSSNLDELIEDTQRFFRGMAS